MKRSYLLILLFLTTNVSAGHKVSPGQGLWNTTCSSSNIKKLLGTREFQTESCEQYFELRDQVVEAILGPEYTDKWENEFKAECKQYRETSDERLQCYSGKVVNFYLEWNGTEDAFFKAMEKKYGPPKKTVKIYEWKRRDGSILNRESRSLGKKTEIGTGYFYEISPEKIIYAESVTSLASYQRTIFFSPDFFQVLKHKIDQNLVSKKKKENSVNRAEESKLPD